jgi:hypothetical protein
VVVVVVEVMVGVGVGVGCSSSCCSCSGDSSCSNKFNGCCFFLSDSCCWWYGGWMIWMGKICYSIDCLDIRQIPKNIKPQDINYCSLFIAVAVILNIIVVVVAVVVVVGKSFLLFSGLTCTECFTDLVKLNFPMVDCFKLKPFFATAPAALKNEA